ncbi:hypothetical protein PHYBLDRAFT_176255 [Phycomyces blakesleeanus NRRL 1555(-)]|uniref:SWIM-type domain-containing protein n=1 Tax=Phycomyces blakesleeanus (strain ATCC 8743b / DSM 1359 / FGSC 10004 / NBRC 33097 / NRRL 1555) TaxID=763407 RepID=A0A162T9U7_PHYB8|nr:hypothetical protein PHYBLDRAFT_176255 [Phycomyces blakesleeanus NRRL 1555(-)]OAD65343.1 hypothetical protein PHYBLDRAFT_176255 [Phycomyces blakesleeanus NRRL 1555(-)]|eukprot:XP_018283383.1 hypothetical protein PHYBLDRAFT_176255 [Phycomyces blakesleeanus NRRL 1555(-)]
MCESYSLAMHNYPIKVFRFGRHLKEPYISIWIIISSEVIWTTHSIPKVNAITSAFPCVAIHYCEFHILCAWQTNLNNKVRLDASFTSAQLAAYKQELKNKLKYILTESNEELKTIYFGCARIGRLDCLMFVLTNDVEYFYEQEVDCIHLNNGKMGLIEDDILPSMIISPLNVISTSMDDSDGEWQIKSFTNDTTWYSITVVNDLIECCLCPRYISQQVPCKHVFLLKRYHKINILYTIQRDVNHLAMQRPAVLAEEEEVVIVDEEDGREDVVGAQNNVDTSITGLITHTTLLHHQRLNLKHM